MKKRFWMTAAAAAVMTECLGNAAAAEETYHVGICQLIQHEALDSATRGFKDALTEKFGDEVVIEEQNAQGDFYLCSTIINGFVAGNVDLILANSTASLQTAATATSQIPILGTSVTKYEAALQLDDFDGTVGGNISGTSDLAPLDEQASMIQELFPKAETVGLLYCSAEPNSQYQIDVMTEELEARGYTCREYGFSDSNDIASVTTNATMECDVIFVPTDNTAASNAELIANVCIPAGIPVVAGEEGICRICGVATLSIDYYDLGYTTGQMAVRILADGEDISTMPIEYAPAVTKEYNKEICEKLGLEIPEDYVELQME
ncbi:ABC transporter substrate binding protein [Marvinbryantia formatexigens DSM 14469]|uniref:ABC transporter substrate binding protein n=1 Tax=Marvinbryantia formatexigens DSM 14469 TaxID=478749 RepID=C6LJP3_9FIRM|nr:ABC transporter substrate-binding protein [Marvinbryantia formatexigens]EET59166.1 ABC transporter substrate binding protein [Marvinbryantia formatexigens DSM 14469]SDG12018.1 putative ABC transport system substrate-binding protein [Marvinbryantia formatexigens]